MWKKILILSCSIAMLLVMSGHTSLVYAGDNGIEVNWQIAGTIVQSIEVTPIFAPPGPHSLINLSAKGSPGAAKITLLSMTSYVPPTGWVFDCSQLQEYPDGPAYFIKNDFVAIFPDQSLLFSSVDSGGAGSHLCFGETGTDFKVEMIVTGGTGRFEGAWGNLTGEGTGYIIHSLSDLSLVAENGTITGTIYLSQP